MALPVYRTLGELRLELAEELGYEADPEGANARALANRIRRSQQLLWEQLTGWTREIVDFELETQADVWRYEWPDGADPDRVQYVYLHWDEDQVHALAEGFGVAQYDLRDEYTSWPTRYRRRDLIEVFPTPDAAYRMVIGAQRRLMPLDTDESRCTVPDDMVLLQAVVLGYERQGRPIPQVTAALLAQRIGQIRARSHEGPYRAGGTGAPEPWPRPRIAGVDG